MEQLLDDFRVHFASKVLTTVAALQSIEQRQNTDQLSEPTHEPGWTIDCAGEAILSCLQNLSKSKACYCIHMCLLYIYNIFEHTFTRYKLLIIIIQIATFLRTNISYDGQDAYGIVLNKVPNLDATTKKLMRDYVRAKTIPKRGIVSNPRPFLTDDKAEQQEVCIMHIAWGVV